MICLAMGTLNWYNQIWLLEMQKEVRKMKKGIHPKYEKAIVTCACGNEFETRSTKKNIRIEVCSNCHPFYTGSRTRMVEKGGRVERFKKKYGIK